MGNICRSPSAEGFFTHHLARAGKQDLVRADSAGTHDYHIGDPPDARAIRQALEHGVDISGLRARKVERADFSRFDLIVAMDEHNLRMLDHLRPGEATGRIALMMDWAPQLGFREVPDPYYGNQSDFRLMCELLDEATRALVASLGD